MDSQVPLVDGPRPDTASVGLCCNFLVIREPRTVPVVEQPGVVCVWRHRGTRDYDVTAACVSRAQRHCNNVTDAFTRGRTDHFSNTAGGVAQWLAEFVAWTKLTHVGPG